MQEEFFSEKIGKLAKDLLAKQIFVNENTGKPEIISGKTCDTINEEEKEYIRQQVKNIPIALQKINYEIISVKERPQLIEFTEKELNILGEYEHKRSSLEKKELGWVYGPVFDNKKKTLPSLVPWETLPVELKSNIINNVKTWPEILANSNFNIERLQFLCKCEAQLIIK